MIPVQCESCKAVLRVPDSKAGVRGRCPVCGKPVVVPLAAAPQQGDTPSFGAAPGLRAAPRAPSPHPQAAWRTAPAREEPPAAIPTPLAQRKECPSCRRPVAFNAKICVQCGVRLPSGRPLTTVRDLDLDELEVKGEKVIRGVSWLVPFGLYPVASEAMGNARPYVTWAIAALTICLSIYAWGDDSVMTRWMLWSGTPSQADARELALEGYTNLPAYHPYQLITHIFLHADIMHLAGNLVFLLVLGSRVNSAIGNIATAVLYPLLGVAAAGAQMWSTAAKGGLHASLGASGAIMGLAGMYLMLFPMQKVYMAIWMRWGLFVGFRLSYKIFAVWGILVVLFFVAFDVVYTLLKVETGVAHWAHMGGMAAGAGTAILLIVARIIYCPGDLLSLTLGRYAWILTGTPASRLKRS